MKVISEPRSILRTVNKIINNPAGFGCISKTSEPRTSVRKTSALTDVRGSDEHRLFGFLLFHNFIHPGDEVVCAVACPFGHRVTLVPDGGKLDIFDTVVILQCQS